MAPWGLDSYCRWGRSDDTCAKTPPTDYDTAASPPTRSDIYDDNPFIQFRRYADSQMSSLFQSVIGLPNLFQNPPSKPRWIVIHGNGNEVVIDGDEETIRHKEEIEDSWRRQREQEAHGLKSELNANADSPKKMRVGCRRGARNSPDQSVLKMSGSDEPQKKSFSLLDRLGFDGKQKQAEQDPSTSKALVPKATVPSSDPFPTNDDDFAQRLNPFSGYSQDAHMWLTSSRYSPVVLRSDIPSDIKFGTPAFFHAINHSEWPDFHLANSADRFDKEIRSKVPWLDAFEDLVSLHNTGEMVCRDEPTRCSSWDWMRGAWLRGSLGKYWTPLDEWAQTGMGPLRVGGHGLFGALDESFPFYPEDRIRDFIKYHSAQSGTARLEEHSVFGPFQPAETKSSGKAKAIDATNKVLVEEVFPSPEAVTAALQAAASTELPAESASSITELDVYEYQQELQQQGKERQSSLTTSPKPDSPSSIISTLTTKTTRTLPDGSIETRRVLKKRFADGREEGEESVEHVNPKTGNKTVPSIMQTPSEQNPEEQKPSTNATSTRPLTTAQSSANSPPSTSQPESFGSRLDAMVAQARALGERMDRGERRERATQTGNPMETRVQEVPDKVQKKQPGTQEQQKRKGGGWFWN